MLWVLLLVQTMAAFAGYSVIPLGPYLRDHFSLSRAQVGLFMTAYYGGGALLGIPMGWATDRWGVRRMLGVAAGGLGVLVGVMAGANTFVVLLVLIFAAGMVYSGTTPATNKGIMRHFSARRRGTVLGIKQTGVTVGNALAAFSLPWVAERWSWRVAIALVGGTLILTALYAWRAYRNPALRETREGPQDSATAGDVAAVDTRNSLTTVRKNRGVIILSSVIVIFIWCQFSVATYLMFFLNERLQVPIVVAGYYLALVQIGATAGRILWGFVSDRWFGGRRQGVLIGVGALAALSTAGLVLLGIRPSVWFAAPLALLIGLTTTGWHGIYLILLIETAGTELAGTATGLSLSIGYLGAIIGTPLFGLIVDQTGSYRAGWLIVAGAVAAATVLLLFSRIETKPIVNCEL